jgi:tetratricopeptide (TPR) repeat protein
VRRAHVAVVLLASGVLARADAEALGAPQPMSHLPDSIAGWARGAQLFSGLGDFHRGITTSSAPAQQYFDQGMRLLWAFNHDEATRSFAKAVELDPACAACYWGLALTVGPNYNLPAMDAVRARVAFAALNEAQQHAVGASAVEQALIGSLTARYTGPQPLAGDNLTRALSDYAAAMRAVAASFPDDRDVQTLCAEAQMNVHAWKLWRADGQPAPGTLDIEARLEAVLRLDPNHPGANHYYIHVMEASPHPEKALASAERLRGLMPAAGHLEHMPAHILQRIGRYEDAAEANRRAVAADEAYLREVTPPDYYVMYLAHNYAFLAYAAAMEGRKAETLAAVQGVMRAVPLETELEMGGSGWNLTQQYAALVRFGLWDEMIALGPPDPRAKGLVAGYLYGRGVALASRGRIEEAQGALSGLQTLDAQSANERLQGVLRVAEPIVAARIAATLEHRDAAIALLAQAVAAEDRLSYHEPADWFFPVRQLLGAQLLIAGKAVAAERVYREDLRHNPANGWALYGLAAALRTQGRSAAAAQVRREFAAAWRHADVRLVASAFWFAGPDTTSCECQRQASAERQARGEFLRSQHEAGVD